MSSASKVSSKAALRYATALLELAQDKKKLDKVAEDLESLLNMIKESEDLRMLVHSPLFSKAQKAEGLGAVATKAKFQDLTQNFLSVLVHNGRLNALEQIIHTFEEALAKTRGEITVNVQVAQDLNAEQKKSLEASISKTIGADVTLKLKVEPDILGGMIVTVGSHMVDDSVARKLERLQSAMGKQSNTNSPENLKTA